MNSTQIASLLIGCLGAFAAGVLVGHVLILPIVLVIWLSGIAFGEATK